MMLFLLATCLFALVALSESSSSSSTSSTSSHYGRRLHAQENRIERQIKAQLQNYNNARNPRRLIKREAYQARFSRTTNMGLNNTLDRVEGRTIGPVLVVAKTSSRDIISDSFDGNVDGKDDVKAARDAWAATSSVSTQETELSNFLRQIRNRATVNGGSIDLRALVVSGRNAAGQFVKFSDDTILITPCFPVTNEAGYNFEFWAGGLNNGLGASLLRSPTIQGADLIDANGNFIDTLARASTAIADNGFYLRRETAIQPAVAAVAADATATPPVVAVAAQAAVDFTNTDANREAAFVLQKCTQFSYFE